VGLNRPWPRQRGSSPQAASALVAMGVFFSSLETPMPPALPAPRRTSRAMVRRWLTNQVTCGSTSDNLCYADNEERSHFHPGQHVAYNARVVFRTKLSDSAPGAGKASAYERWKARHPKRGTNAQRAYDDFLRGLEVAGMQETLDTTASSITPAGMTDGERREILEELAGKPIFPGGPVVKLGGSDSKKCLLDLARWERLVTLRRDATLRRKWYAELHARATSLVADGEMKDYKPKPLIRNNTFKLLVRPAEVDFDPLRFALMGLSIFTFGYAFYTQIDSIVKLCSGPFLCPGGGLWKHRPLVAPPVALRKASGFTTTSETYYRELEPVCKFGEAGCAKPGYKVEWPYLQTSSSSEEFPTELKKFCKSKVAGTDGYVFDYISSTLRTEYWQCEKGSLPFMEAGTPFHFDSDWYNSARTVTIACMEEQNPDRASWEKKISSFDIADIELCFLNNPLFSAGEGGKCNCKTDNARFMMGTGKPGTYSSRNTHTLCMYVGMYVCMYVCMYTYVRVCVRVVTRLRVCLCLDYIPGFLNEENINTHTRYGCFFASPSATKSVELEYSACTATPAPSVTVGAASKGKYRSETLRIANLPLGQYISKSRGGSPSLQASRKTALLLFFLFKEGGPLVCAVGAFALAILSAIVALLLAPITRIYASFMKGPAKAHFIAYMWNLFEDVVAEALNVVWPLCMGMSVAFRVWELSRKMVFSTQCNASLIKDGVNKVTGVLNIMFNLVVLIFSDANFTDQGYLWISIILSVFNLVIQILVEKEKQKFITSLFKDINENRLSKFELALGITKCIEDFLEDDVQFNFVQHLTGDGRVRPSVLDEYDVLGKEAFDAQHNTYDEAEEWRFSNGSWRDKVCGSLQDPGEETIFPFFPLLPKDLKDTYGSDDKYEWANESKVPEKEGMRTVSVNAGGGAVAAMTMPPPATAAMTMMQYPPMPQFPPIANGPPFGSNNGPPFGGGGFAKW
jgi:hypothetical protein